MSAFTVVAAALAGCGPRPPPLNLDAFGLPIIDKHGADLVVLLSSQGRAQYTFTAFATSDQLPTAEKVCLAKQGVTPLRCDELARPLLEGFQVLW